MERLPVIPTPFAQRWRSFKLNVLPVVAFMAVLLVVASMWRDVVGVSFLAGEVEPIRAQVIVPQSGRLESLHVQRFQFVSKGDLVAVVTPTDPRMAYSGLQADLDVLRSRLDSGIAMQRTGVDYERLRLDWLVQEVDLSSDRVQLELAENELKRSARLIQDQLISESDYDLALKTRDALRIAVSEKERLVRSLGEGLERLRAVDARESLPGLTNLVTRPLADIEARLAAIRTRQSVASLQAPIDGVVQDITRQVGEHVLEGDVLVTIASTDGRRIVGYVRQPMPLEPQVGMAVEVRTRASRRVVSRSRIEHVGAQFELITNGLAIVRQDGTLDYGLPIAVTVPDGMKLRPGERVDMELQP